MKEKEKKTNIWGVLDILRNSNEWDKMYPFAEQNNL